MGMMHQADPSESRTWRLVEREARMTPVYGWCDILAAFRVSLVKTQPRASRADDR